MATTKFTPEQISDKPELHACGTCGTVLPFDLEHFQYCRSGLHKLRVHCRPCNRAIENARTKDSRIRLRLEALRHYSGGEPACACCGETLYEMLALDHLEGGSQDDQRHFGSLDKMLIHLRREGWPAGLQCLCHNCNAVKSICGTTGRFCCVHHPEQRPAGFYARKGRPKNPPLVPLAGPANGTQTRACVKCNRVFPLDVLHFFWRKDQSRFRNECKECRSDGRLDALRVRRAAKKLQAMTHYSGGKPRCECCGITAIEFLTIDHIEGGGEKHRQEEGFSDICHWLVSNGLPPGYRVLCYGCNMASYKFGGCPHATGASAVAQHQEREKGRKRNKKRPKKTSRREVRGGWEQVELW